MAKHKHADLILAFALDAQVSETPWEWWEYYLSNAGRWESFNCTPDWFRGVEYRRKLDAPPLPTLPVLSDEQLIAAAPDLLEVCMRIKAWSNSDLPFKLGEMLDAAISKARGE